MKKVAIVGVEGSGKTVMLAGLGDLYTYPDAGGYFLAPKNFGTAAYVAEKIESMRRGEWPSATAGDEMQGLDWTLKRQKPGDKGRPETICEVSFLDFAGEVYRAAYGIAGEDDAAYMEQAEALKQYVRGADELIVLINLRDVITHGLGDKRVQEAMWITKSILDTALGGGAYAAPRAAIVLSQADSYAETIRACGGARGVLAKYLPHVANEYGWLNVFAANAVDKTTLDGDGRDVPAPDFTTQGLLPIMRWICGEEVGGREEPDDGTEASATAEDGEEEAPNSQDEVGALYSPQGVNSKVLSLAVVLGLAVAGGVTWWVVQKAASSKTAAHERWRADKESRRRDEDAATVRTAYKLFESGDYETLLQGPETKDSTLPDVQYLQGRVLSYGLTGSLDLAKAIQMYEAAAKDGHALATVDLGTFYCSGWGVKKDVAHGLELVEKGKKEVERLADEGNPYAQDLLGDLHGSGWGYATNKIVAAKWHKQAADQGDVIAMSSYGSYLLEGNGVETNVVAATNLLERAYLRGDWAAGLALVDFWIEKDRSKAELWYGRCRQGILSAAEQGVPHYQYRAGLLYAEGLWGEKNMQESMRWFSKAAEQGDMMAQFKIGEIYLIGADVRQDPGMGVKWLRKAAEQGHAEAQNLLGVAYGKGLGVKQDYDEAIRWHTKAAEQGLVGAQFNLGQLYLNRKEYLNAMTWLRKAADQGDADAQNIIGCLFFRGLGVDQDYTEALKWCRKAVEQNLPVAQYNLGEMYWDGTGVDRDYGTAVAWYRKAADQKYANAQNKLGIAYGKGLGVKQDYDEAIRWHTKAAEQGLVGAQGNLGQLYFNRKEYRNAMTWFRKAAEQNDADAQNKIGLMYFRGLGVDQDYTEALTWCRKAAEQDLPVAQYNLGKMYWDGTGVDRDYATAVAWFRKAADQKYADAQNMLGLAYRKGLGVKQDYDEAIRWFTKAAEQGLVGAQFNLGQLYWDRKDYPNALTWLRKAADQNDAGAQNMMGLAYDEGWGVAKNDHEAVTWYTKAAEQNLRAAQYNLGLMYLNGEGVNQDKRTAVEWIRKAAAQGYDDAKKKLKELGY